VDKSACLEIPQPIVCEMCEMVICTSVLDAKDHIFAVHIELLLAHVQFYKHIHGVWGTANPCNCLFRSTDQSLDRLCRVPSPVLVYATLARDLSSLLLRVVLLARWQLGMATLI
jgi:hypothetical protein